MIAFVKFFHLAGMLIWCGGLIALPLLLSIYGGSRRQSEFAEFRLITHYCYVLFVTPAALIAIVAGTLLIFLDGVYVEWLLVKLVLVSGMTLIHAYIGHLINKSGETKGAYRMPSPVILLGAGLPMMAGVLWLVLAKPELGNLTNMLPTWMTEPQELLS